MTTPSRSGPWAIFLTFLSIGIQSFGGGSSTLFLTNQAVLKNNWMTQEEFVHLYALVQISPGINLIKLTLLIGQKLCGWRGLVAGVAGLLLPSAGVTVLMTAGFAAVRGQPLVQAALRGVLPATIGLGLAMSIQMAQPLLTRAHREGRMRLGSSLAILAGAAGLMALGSVTPLLVLLLSGGAAVLLLAVIPARQPAEAQ